MPPAGRAAVQSVDCARGGMADDRLFAAAAAAAVVVALVTVVSI